MENVDCLLVAKPVAINHLGIHYNCCWQFVKPVVSSSLWRPWSLLLPSDKENCAWNLWDRGTRWVLVVAPFHASFFFWLILGCNFNSSTGLMNSLVCKQKWPLVPISSGRVLLCIRVKWIVVTWLILPVVICLSQRLSHACLSINNFVLWNCEWLIKSVIVYLMLPCYMDNCGNSRANTCNQAPTSGRGVFIR